jgi:hypothetical protein
MRLAMNLPVWMAGFVIGKIFWGGLIGGVFGEPLVGQFFEDVGDDCGVEFEVAVHLEGLVAPVLALVRAVSAGLVAGWGACYNLGKPVPPILKMEWEV